MRYEDWDVILFPRDSHVPIQEFKTACYSSQDARGKQSPTLSCYISSLPPSTPFRISVHSWAPVNRPSAVIESRRKPDQKITYMFQVLVDGTRVFRGFFDMGSKWPQEITHEKRTVAAEHPTSQRRQRLEFPPFDTSALLQPTWQPRETGGRINIVLSEQLISNNDSPGELGLGTINDIVCLSFQHAPRDVLEQAGISWPIRNPLFLPDAHGSTHTGSPKTEPLPTFAESRDTARNDAPKRSPESHVPAPTFSKTRNAEPMQRPNSHPPPFQHFPKPPIGAHGFGRTGIWDESFGSFRENSDNISLDSFSTHRTTSNPNGDVFMGECMFPLSQPSKPRAPWARVPPPKYQIDTNSVWDEQRSMKDKDRPVIMTLRDDQFGQIIEAISPKRHPGLPHGSGAHHHDYIARPSTAQAYYPPQMGNMPVTGRPSAAAIARKSSYPDLQSSLSNKPNRLSPDKSNVLSVSTSRSNIMHPPSTSSNKENRPPSQARMPAVFPYANRVPTPHPFAPRLPEWGSETAGRDGSSVFSSFNRHNGANVPTLFGTHGKHSAAHTPSSIGGVKSRKEGLAHHSASMSEHDMRHDQSLLPPLGTRNTNQKPTTRDRSKAMHGTPSMPPKPVPDIVEIIDVDAIDPSLSNDTTFDATKLSPFKPNHKVGTSSMDSTSRLEHHLLNALGEELHGHSEMNAAGMGPDLAQALGGSAAPLDLSASPSLNPTASDFEPIAKRKRQGTLGGDRDRSPLSKKEKGQMEAEGVEEQDMPRLRGD